MQNSFIPPCPFYELQMDSSYVERTQLEVVSFLLLDIFTKYMVVVPIQNNLEGDIAAGMIENLKNEWRWMENRDYYICMMIQLWIPLDCLKEEGVSHFGIRRHPNLSEKAQ